MKWCFVIMLVLSQVNVSLACVCDHISPIKEYIVSDLVLVGHIDEVVAYDSISYKIKFTISELFKGDSISEIIVFSGSKFSHIHTSCDIEVNAGEEWLIYAMGFDNQYGFGYCGNSKKLNKLNQTDQAELKILKAPDDHLDYTPFSMTELDQLPHLDTPDSYTLRLKKYKKAPKTVYVELHVSFTGEILGVRVVKGADSAVDKEVLKYVGTFKNVNPGLINGINVNCRWIVPIKVMGVKANKYK